MHSVSKDRADIAAADRQSAPRPYAEPRAVVARTVAEQPAQRRESQAADASVGHLSLSPPYGPMDFAGWFEAFLSGRWYTFDPRNNTPRMGRGLIALGRDAADVLSCTPSVPIRLSASRCGRTRSASPVSPSPAGRLMRQASTGCKGTVWETRSPKISLASSTPRN